MNHRDMLISKAHEQLEETAEMLFSKSTRAERKDRARAARGLPPAKEAKAAVTIEPAAKVGRLRPTSLKGKLAVGGAVGGLVGGGAAGGLYLKDKRAG